MEKSRDHNQSRRVLTFRLQPIAARTRAALGHGKLSPFPTGVGHARRHQSRSFLTLGTALGKRRSALGFSSPSRKAAAWTEKFRGPDQSRRVLTFRLPQTDALESSPRSRQALTFSHRSGARWKPPITVFPHLWGDVKRTKNRTRLPVAKLQGYCEDGKIPRT